MDDSFLRKYLLGELPPAERDAVGREVILDPEFHSRIRDVENDLIDACARGDLSAVEAQKVRAYLDATQQGDRLRFAEALRQRQPRAKKTWWVAAGIAAGICVAIPAAWVVLGQGGADSPTSAPPAVVSTSVSRIVRFSLAAGTVRDAATIRTIRIPIEAETVEFDIEREELSRYREIEVDLKLTSGRQVDSRREPAATLRIAVARKLLLAGSYELALTGIDADGKRELLNYYYFRVQ